MSIVREERIKRSGENEGDLEMNGKNRMRRKTPAVTRVEE